MTVFVPPAVPAPGVISAYDSRRDAGHLTLSDGGELPFGGGACKGFKPVAGLPVKVTEVTRLPDGACVAASLDRTASNDLYIQLHLEAAAKTARWHKALEASRNAMTADRTRALAALPSPLAAARKAGLMERLGLDLWSGAVLTFGEFLEEALCTDQFGERGGVCLTTASLADAWLPGISDPCFLPLVSADGDALGLYVYPPALAVGEDAPVVFYSHEGDPGTFELVAPSVSAFLRQLRPNHFIDADTYRRAFAALPPHTGRAPELSREAWETLDVPGPLAPTVSQERRLVHERASSGARSDERRKALEGYYELAGWPLAAAALRYEREDEEWEARILGDAHRRVKAREVPSDARPLLRGPSCIAASRYREDKSREFIRMQHQDGIRSPPWLLSGQAPEVGMKVLFELFFVPEEESLPALIGGHITKVLDARRFLVRLYADPRGHTALAGKEWDAACLFVSGERGGPGVQCFLEVLDQPGTVRPPVTA